ncbi:MAG: sensor histidine kinase, partial [Planctomycetota bacterium]
QADASIRELKHLAESFNDMSIRLKEREVTLKANSEKMSELNKSYMDLLGFVAHELKGLLASAVINAYSLRDGYLGMINFKQKKAVDSICRNLDYLDATVRKFLNLSRIERGNLDINKTEFSLSRDIFDVSIETFAKFQRTRNMEIVNEIDPELMIHADRDLMQIVANNLLNNAIKYGTEGGQIRLTCRDKGEFITLDVYNDSRPIAESMKNQLFKKFSRLDVPEKKMVKGTGLGLYITKQIVESHGGTIGVKPKEQGNSFIFTIRKE